MKEWWYFQLFGTNSQQIKIKLVTISSTFTYQIDLDRLISYTKFKERKKDKILSFLKNQNIISNSKILSH